MQNWIKTLVVGSCLLTMLLHMIPNGKFVKYVRFYAGLIFVLLAMQPVIQLFSGGHS
ncbi:MAG: stage III sporulation protein AF [Lachnospiraceae bacterium]